MRALVLILVLVGTGCRAYVDPLCRPCEPGGCSDGLRCQTTRTGGGVCVPQQGTLAACSLSGPADAGLQDAALDAGLDAGVQDIGPSDAGASRSCPEAEPSGLTWIYSPYADLCFTKTEVTAAQFNACVDSSCTDPINYQAFAGGSFEFCNIGSQSYSEYPANCIKLVAGAEDFCTYVGGRLPTEQEWYAEASAGGTRTYPWGEERATCAHAVMDEGTGAGCGDGALGQIPCQRPAGHSASGLCDMAGNLWELTATSTGADRIMRGGEYRSVSGAVRATSWATYEPGAQGHIGFRCVTDPLL